MPTALRLGLLHALQLAIIYTLAYLFGTHMPLQLGTERASMFANKPPVLISFTGVMLIYWFMHTFEDQAYAMLTGCN